MKPLLKESIIYQAVESGELIIDKNGCVWRTSFKVGLKTGGTTIVKIQKRRAEHDIGPYLQIRKMVNWERTYCSAHRLVYHHFFGPIPDGMVINHKNGKKKDNRPENLEVVTHSENVLHAVHVLKVGRTAHQMGEKNHASKLTEAIVIEILKHRAVILEEIKTRHGKNISKLATKYGVSYGTIWNVIKGHRWNPEAL